MKKRKQHLSNDFYKIYNGVRSKITLFENLMHKREDDCYGIKKYSKSNSEDYFLDKIKEVCINLKKTLLDYSLFIEKFNFREVTKCKEMLEAAIKKTIEVDGYIKAKKCDKNLIKLLIDSRIELNNTIDVCNLIVQKTSPRKKQTKENTSNKKLIIQKRKIIKIYKAILSQSNIKIKYKGEKRVMLPLYFTSDLQKVQAIHVDGYSKSQSENMHRCFFVSEIEIIT